MLDAEGGARSQGRTKTSLRPWSSTASTGFSNAKGIACGQRKGGATRAGTSGNGVRKERGPKCPRCRKRVGLVHLRSSCRTRHEVMGAFGFAEVTIATQSPKAKSSRGIPSAATRLGGTRCSIPILTEGRYRSWGPIGGLRGGRATMTVVAASASHRKYAHCRSEPRPPVVALRGDANENARTSMTSRNPG